MYKTTMLTKDLVAASSKPMVLSILAGGESYGYENIQKVRELSGGGNKRSGSKIYTALHSLVRAGGIESEWRESETGRERKYYFLSRDGRKALQDERHQWLTVHNT